MERIGRHNNNNLLRNHGPVQPKLNIPPTHTHTNERPKTDEENKVLLIGMVSKIGDCLVTKKKKNDFVTKDAKWIFLNEN